MKTKSPPRRVRAVQDILERAREIDATTMETHCAAMMYAQFGAAEALRYLDGCRKHFESAAQVRAFLRGHRWAPSAIAQLKIKRHPNHPHTRWLVKVPVPDTVMFTTKWGVPDVINPVLVDEKGIGAEQYAATFRALQALYAGTNADVWPG